MQETTTERSQFATWLRGDLATRLRHEPLCSTADTRYDSLDIQKRYPLMLLSALEGTEPRMRPFLVDEDRDLLDTLAAVVAARRWDMLPDVIRPEFDAWCAYEASKGHMRALSCSVRRKARMLSVPKTTLASLTGIPVPSLCAWLDGDDDSMTLGELATVGRVLRRVSPGLPATDDAPGELSTETAGEEGTLDERGRKALSQAFRNVGELSRMAPGTHVADDALEVVEALTRRMVTHAHEMAEAGFDLSHVFDDESHAPCNQFGVGHAVMDYVCLDMVWGVDRMSSEAAECLRRRIDSARSEDLAGCVDMGRDTSLARRCGRAVANG